MRLVTFQKIILVFIIVLKAKQRKALKNVGVAVICWSMRKIFSEIKIKRNKKVLQSLMFNDIKDRLKNKKDTIRRNEQKSTRGNKKKIDWKIPPTTEKSDNEVYTEK